jgi:hypothetical protein
MDKNAPGAAANRVALEACVQARNEGCDLAREGNEIIQAATYGYKTLPAPIPNGYPYSLDIRWVDKIHL